MRDIAVRRVVHEFVRPDAVRRNAVNIRHRGFDARFVRFVEFVAARVEHFDAVIFGRIVRRADHDPEIRLIQFAQIRNAGRRQNIDVEHFAAALHDACGKRVRQHTARSARISADHDPTALDALRQRIADRMRKLRRDLAIGNAANAVRTEIHHTCVPSDSLRKRNLRFNCDARSGLISARTRPMTKLSLGVSDTSVVPAATYV